MKCATWPYNILLPLKGNCQVNDVVYKHDITKPSPKKVYLRLAVGEWRSRLYNHKLTFKNKKYSNKTTPPSYMWHLKSVSSEIHNLKWSVLRCVPPYSNISEKCLLCSYEKLEIITYQNQKESWTRDLSPCQQVRFKELHR